MNYMSFSGNSVHAKIENQMDLLNSKFEYRNTKQIQMTET